MIEMLGVLAIIGVLSVGGIAGYSKAMLKYKTNKTIDSVTMLVTNIRTLYAQQNTFNGLNEAEAVNMGVVPDELFASGTKTGNLYTSVVLTNPFAGSVTIKPTYSVPGTAGADRAFIIGVTGIPKETCMSMATADWGSNYSSGLIGMAITNQSGASEGEGANKKEGTAASKLLEAGATAADNAKIYAGADCVSKEVGVGNLGGGSTSTTAKEQTAAYCAKDLPIDVAVATQACNCSGSNCSFAIKYY
ncbi:MAG: hypothetical protein IKO06_01155 [Alphaproteobacteria bacterium]|nr:hypothetical protein [Alphaproteobacteria bacterium]